MEGAEKRTERMVSFESCRTCVEEQRRELEGQKKALGLNPARETALCRALTLQER